jgi:hypothetical protein
MAVSSASGAQSQANVAFNITKKSQLVNAQAMQNALETARVIADSGQSASRGAQSISRFNSPNPFAGYCGASGVHSGNLFHRRFSKMLRELQALSLIV